MSKCIFGLGNPEEKYTNTRHNAGFMAVEYLARCWDVKVNQHGFLSLYGIKEEEDVFLVKPLTYMNRSGECVAKFVEEGITSPSDLLIIHDDMDIPLGVMRFKKKNGDGGHKGVRSVIYELGTDIFARLRLGIGKPPPPLEPTEYVLGVFSEEEMKKFRKLLSLLPEAVEIWLKKGIESAMNIYNNPQIYEEVQK